MRHKNELQNGGQAVLIEGGKIQFLSKSFSCYVWQVGAKGRRQKQLEQQIKGNDNEQEASNKMQQSSNVLANDCNSNSNQQQDLPLGCR